MKRILTLVAFVSMLAVPAALGGHGVALAGAGATKCTGTLPPGTYTNVDVPKGAACTLTASDVITGNVRALAGNTLTITGTSIGGSLKDVGGGTLTQSGATIGGEELVKGPTGAPIGVSICSSTIAKTVTVESGAAGSDILFGDTVGGGCSAGNTVGVDGKFDSNAWFMDVGSSSFGKNLYVENNTGGGVVENNTITDTCEAFGNNPPLTFSGNTEKTNKGCTTG